MDGVGEMMTPDNGNGNGTAVENNAINGGAAGGSTGSNAVNGGTGAGR